MNLKKIANLSKNVKKHNSFEFFSDFLHKKSCQEINEIYGKFNYLQEIKHPNLVEYLGIFRSKYDENVIFCYLEHYFDNFFELMNIRKSLIIN